MKVLHMTLEGPTVDVKKAREIIKSQGFHIIDEQLETDMDGDCEWTVSLLLEAKS
jgi:hypothetical protein